MSRPRSLREWWWLLVVVACRLVMYPIGCYASVLDWQMRRVVGLAGFVKSVALRFGGPLPDDVTSAGGAQ